MPVIPAPLTRSCHAVPVIPAPLTRSCYAVPVIPAPLTRSCHAVPVIPAPLTRSCHAVPVIPALDNSELPRRRAVPVIPAPLRLGPSYAAACPAPATLPLAAAVEVHGPMCTQSGGCLPRPGRSAPSARPFRATLPPPRRPEASSASHQPTRPPGPAPGRPARRDNFRDKQAGRAGRRPTRLGMLLSGQLRVHRPPLCWPQ